jgi:hypothetical protein
MVVNTPDKITQLESDQVFVFGSNLAGRHGAGAALTAYRKFGARIGVGFGRTGQCYAIPTKDKQLNTLPLEKIEPFVWEFLVYCGDHRQLIFLVTPIGCGLAGYKPYQIAGLFRGFRKPGNLIMPACFEKYLT